MRTTAILVLSAVMVSALPLAGPGSAGNCYEDIGCASTGYFSQKALRKLGCQPLWDVRNAIFDGRGYCFLTERAREQFSNAGCRYTSKSRVPLNRYERANVSAIRGVEAAKGCN